MSRADDRPSAAAAARAVGTGATLERPFWAVVLRALREARGVTQEGWAAQLGIARSTLVRWERGEVVPDARAEEALLALCAEKGLYRRYDRGPLTGVTVTPDWLRDLLAAARVDRNTGELAHAHTVSTTAPPGVGSVAVPTGNLPAPLSSFVGRQGEITEVQRLLAGTRLLTLTGTGGVGKTRLAVEVARRVRAAYPAGVWLVELAPLTDPALVPQAVAAALGVRETPGQPLAETLIAWFKPRRLLLVLDNCEHLVAACAQLAEALLRACPEVQVLATSREALAMGGEVQYHVPSLSVPDVAPLPSMEQLSQYDAIHLFVERARAISPSFAVTDDTARAVLDICRRLDGIPLAIELAAARVNVLSVEQIAARLDDRFRLLTGGSRTAPTRHQTLQATIAWSWDLLAEPERVLLRRLAVFAGGGTLEAAEAVCAGTGVEPDEVLDLLAHLVDKSLVVIEEQDGAVRYRLLETLRQYSAERLEGTGEAAAVRSRHGGWFLALAERAGAGADGAGPAGLAGAAGGRGRQPARGARVVDRRGRCGRGAAPGRGIVAVLVFARLLE